MLWVCSQRTWCLLTLPMYSTITYDTLVRAGVKCTSAFVSSEERIEGSGTYEKNPPFAKGSRGINILPDTYFSPQTATPVCGDPQRVLMQLD